MSNNGANHLVRGAPHEQRALGGSLACNRCNKPVSTTLFVCGCFCLFCEACTIEHFQMSHNCPSCGRTLQEKDFMDLAVTDPPAVPDSIKPAFQKLLRKKSSLPTIQYADMTSTFLRQYNELGSVARFLFKQIVESSGRDVQDKGGLQRENEMLRQELVQSKQSNATLQLEHQAIVGDLQHQLQARDGTIGDLQQQLGEKENVINKFRRLHGGPTSPHATMIPLSSHSHRSTVPMGNHHQVESQRLQQPNHPQQQQQQQEVMPLQGFMANRAAEERNRQQVLQSQLHRGIPVLGNRATSTSTRHHSNIPSGVTPIQVPRHSFGGNSNSPGAPSLDIPGTPRIRDLSSSSGYSFTSRPLNQNHHHHPYASRSIRRTPPAAPVARNNSNSHLSPTMAFARSGHGSTQFGGSNSFGYGH